ncbi:MAG: uroporphyrinogen decarboxylase family protein [Planctomycetota bacterium]
MTSRERILAALDHRPPDRLPLWETTIWPQTLARWYGEGLPGEVTLEHRARLDEYFGLDPLAAVNDLFDPSFGLPVHTLEETDEHRVYVDAYGKTIKEWRDGRGVPSMLAPALRTRVEWERLKPALAVSPEKFNNPAAELQYQAAQRAGHFTAITPPDPMWFILYQTLGFEQGLMCMLREPALVADMAATYTEYLLGMLRLALARGYRFDALWFWSDLCYVNGLLFSPKAGRRFAVPYWTQLAEFAHANGMRLMLHCDGNVGQLIPLLLEAGFDALHPLEARAGNDVREYKRLYGERLCLIGNINADIVATNDPQAIEREVAAKVPVAAAGGGYIYNIDHSVPPTVSLASYRHLLKCVQRYSA